MLLIGALEYVESFYIKRDDCHRIIYWATNVIDTLIENYVRIIRHTPLYYRHSLQLNSSLWTQNLKVIWNGWVVRSYNSDLRGDLNLLPMNRNCTKPRAKSFYLKLFKKVDHKMFTDTIHNLLNTHTYSVCSIIIYYNQISTRQSYCVSCKSTRKIRLNCNFNN